MRNKQRGSRKRKSSTNRQLSGQLSWVKRELKSLNPPQKVTAKIVTPVVTQSKAFPAINIKLFLISIIIALSIFTVLTFISDTSVWNQLSGNEITGAGISVSPVNQEKVTEPNNTPLLEDQSIISSTEDSLIISAGGNTPLPGCSAWPCDCGVINASITMTSNLQCNGTGLSIGADNLILDCANYTINYSIAGASGYGVNNTNFDNTTVRNCNIYEGNATINNKYGIYFTGADNIVISNNTITTVNSTNYGIYFQSSASDSRFFVTTNTLNGKGIFIGTSAGPGTISNNTITASDASGHGIYIDPVYTFGGTDFFIVSNNTITTNGADGVGLYIAAVHYSNFTNNHINTNGSLSYGIRISRSWSNKLSDNIINTSGATAYGVYIWEYAGNNTLLNNNITANQTNEIFDSSGDSYTNYLVYNNMFAQIKWADLRSSGFLKDMDLLDNNGLGIGLGRNLLIGNDTVAFNASAFTDSLINSSANITFFNLTYGNVTQIFIFSNFSANATEIINNGTDCLSSSCVIISYTRTNGVGVLVFNTTGFSSFAVNGTNNSAPNTTAIILNATTSFNATTNDLTCYGNVTDPDSESSLLVNYSWYNNTIAHLSGQASGISLNAMALISTLKSGNTSIGENWSCSIQAYDGVLYEGDWTNSSNITILSSSPPNITAVILNTTSTTNQSNANLTCYTNVSDVDDATVFVNYTWYKNSVEQTSLRGQTSGVTVNTIVLINTATAPEPGNWTCSAQAYDGASYEGDWNNATPLTILNYQCGDTIAVSTVLTADIVGTTTCYNVNSNIIFNCQGHTITGPGGTSKGFNLAAPDSNVTIKNCLITNFSQGIYVSNSDNNKFINNTIYHSNGTTTAYGMYFDTGSENNLITNSTFYNNPTGVYFYTSADSHNLTLSTFYNNSLVGLDIAYGNLNLVTNNSLFNHPAQAITVGSGTRNSSIFYNDIYNNSIGIYSSGGSGSATGTNVSWNNFSSNGYNLQWLTTTNTILTAENNWWGFTNCVNISQNITGLADTIPYLNNPYPNGNSTNCPSFYCGMLLGTSVNLTADQASNLTNCPADGLTVHNISNNLTLDCQSRTISGNNNNRNGIIVGSGEATIKNCIISGFGIGISRSDGTPYIFNNNFTNFGTGVSGSANITNNTFWGNGSSYLSTVGINGSSQIVQGNNFSHLDIAAYTEGSTQFERNYLFNNTLGYDLNGAGNTFNFETVLQSSIAIRLGLYKTVSTNNNFWNSTFANNSLDLRIIEGDGSNITFINTSINRSRFNVFPGGTAYVKWFVDVNVTDNNQNPLANATVIAYDSLGIVDTNQTTNSDGLSRLQVLAVYVTDNIAYFITPHTILAKKNNYTQNSTSVNLYNLTYAKVNLSLTEMTCGSIVFTDLELGNNFTCPGTGLIVGKSNITINGNGNILRGSGSGTGINMTGKANVNITNLKIINFSNGLYLENANNSNLINLNLTNTTQGLVFNYSNENTVANSTFSDNNISILATSTSGTNNHLVNVSVNTNSIIINETATIFLKWYVDVNATYNGGLALANANVSGYFNSSGISDDSVITGSDGLGRLKLTELKKNSSGITYLTPHNITIYYAYQGSQISNGTSLNLSQTNNTRVNLSITLNCTVPLTTNTISSNTTFCPGTFTTGSITLSGDTILTCSDTIIVPTSTYTGGAVQIAVGPGGPLYGVTVSGSNSEIVGCAFSGDFDRAISLVDGKNNLIIRNVTISTSNAFGVGVYCSNSRQMIIDHSTLSAYPGLYLLNCNSSVISNNTFQTTGGITVYNSHYGLFRNNTFKDLSTAITFSDTYPSNNNTFYYNNFSGTTTYHINYFNATASSYNNYFNTTGSGGRGNLYSDYCDKGSDTDNDGYAEASKSGTTDWPYSENITTKIYDPTNGNIGVIDYGPKIQACSAAEVFLGSSSSSSSSTADSGSAPAAAESVPTAAPAAAAADSGSYSSPAEAAQFLTSSSETEFDKFGTKIKFTLENTGTKRMFLFPQLLQEYDDPFFIITRKTLGFENSFFSKLSGVAYSEDAIVGRLLKATLKNDEQIILEPGEKKETVLELEEGLKIPRQIKIQFTTLGEVVTEKTVEQKAFSGTAIDLDTENQLMDLYVVIVPVSEQLEEYYTGNSPTGAAVANLLPSDEYFLEFAINKNSSSFGDLYGPYDIKENQSLVFAQQIKYDPKEYSGSNIIATKVYRGGKVIVEDEFEVDFGTGEPAYQLSWLLFLLPLLLLFGSLSGYSYYAYRQRVKLPSFLPKTIISPPIKNPELKTASNIIPSLKHKTKSVAFNLYLAKRVLLIIGIVLFLSALVFLLLKFAQPISAVIKEITAFFINLGMWIIPLIAGIILIGMVVYAMVIRKFK